MKSKLVHRTAGDFVKLGIYQITGGAVAVFITLWSVYWSSFLSGITAIIYFLVLILPGFSILCGIKCFYLHKNALKYSLVNQVLQVVYCTVAGFAFKYIAGPYFSVEVDLTTQLYFGLGLGISDIELMINSDPEKTKAGINLVAIGIVYWIDKLMKRAKDENEILVVRQIGSEVEPNI